MTAIFARVGDVFSDAWRLIKRNPVRAQALVVASIGLGTAFGLGWTGLQVGAVTAFSAGILSLLTETSVTPLEKPSLPSGTVVNVQTAEGLPDKTVTLPQ